MTSKGLNLQLERLRENGSFCTKAWGGVSISPSGAVAPCCLFEKPISDENGKPFKVWEVSINKIFNGTFMKDIRKKMLNGEKVDACRQCYDREDFGADSFRDLYNYDEEFETLDHYESQKEYSPISIDLKLNNKCNLKCRMCQPRDSILIENEFKKISKDDPSFLNYSNVDLRDPDLGILLSEVPSWEDSEIFHSSMLDMLPGLKKISMVGGEPLIMDQFYKILDLCIDKNWAKNIYVAVTTNLMKVPKEKLDKYLKLFGRFLFNISLDATGKELEYIRYPSSIEKITKNFKDIYSPADNIVFQFTPTVQVYNILYLDQVYLYVEKLMEEGYQFSVRPVNLTHLTFPIHLNINILPPNIRKIAIRRLKQFLVMSKVLVNNSNVMKNYLQVIRILEKDFHPDSDRLLREFLYYSESLDKERGQRMVDFLPELNEKINEAGISSSKPLKNFNKIRSEGWEFAEQKKYLKAISCFEESVLFSTEKYIDYREMAWMKLHLKDIDGAVKSYEKAFKLNSEDKNIVKGLVISYWNANIKNKACDNIKYAIALNPGDQELLDLNKKINLYKE